MLRVLSIEDNATFRQALAALIQARLPYVEMLQAEGGREALELLETFEPELIITDVRLIGESGLELMKKIKLDHAHIPFVVLSQYDLAEYRAAAYRDGASQFLSKDASPNDIVKVVEAIISTKPPAA